MKTASLYAVYEISRPALWNVVPVYLTVLSSKLLTGFLWNLVLVVHLKTCLWNLSFFLTIRSRLHALRPGYGSCPYQYHPTLAIRNVKNGVSSVCIQAVQKDVTEYWKNESYKTNMREGKDVKDTKFTYVAPLSDPQFGHKCRKYP